MRDLKFHRDPVGRYWSGSFQYQHTEISVALQSMVITKQTQIGGEGASYAASLLLQLHMLNDQFTVPEHNDSYVHHSSLLPNYRQLIAWHLSFEGLS